MIWAMRSPIVASSGKVTVEAPPGPRSRVRIVLVRFSCVGCGREGGYRTS